MARRRGQRGRTTRIDHPRIDCGKPGVPKRARRPSARALLAANRLENAEESPTLDRAQRQAIYAPRDNPNGPAFVLTVILRDRETGLRYVGMEPAAGAKGRGKLLQMRDFERRFTEVRSA